MPLGASRLSYLAHQAAPAGRTAKTLTASGNVQISSTQSKFGGASAYFSATTFDTLELDPIIGTSDDWTIEFWLRPNAVGFTEYLMGQDQAATKGFYIYGHSEGVKMFWRNVSAAKIIGSLTANTWQHIAVVKNNTTVEGYVNGVKGSQSMIVAADETVASGSNLFIGDRDSGGNYDGYIDEFRLSSTARYTANFTPSTSAFTNDDDTLLLLHMDGTDGSTTFTDDNT